MKKECKSRLEQCMEKGWVAALGFHGNSLLTASACCLRAWVTRWER